MTTLKQKILQLDFESSFPKPKARGIAMRRWLSAYHQYMEIRDFFKNPRFYFEKDIQRARHITNIFKRSILYLTAKPRRFRTYTISLGLCKYLFSGKTINVHYCISLAADRTEKASEIRVSLSKHTAPKEEYDD